MRPLRVLLVQLPVPNNPATNVPLAAGYLKAYAHAQGLLEHAEIEILPRALADHAGDALMVEAIVARAPDVLGLSLYTWNSERTLDIARRARERLPGLLSEDQKKAKVKNLLTTLRVQGHDGVWLASVNRRWVVVDRRKET